MTLQEIFNYANVLTEDGFNSLADCIDFLNEAQDLISSWDAVQAEPMSFILTSDSSDVWVPDDFISLKKATLDDYPYAINAEPWGGILSLPTGTTGTLKLWYTRQPATLLSTTPTQVPEVKTIYHRSMASYAAKMYHLIDDDPGLREAFKQEFLQSLSAYKTSSGMTANYFNF